MLETDFSDDIQNEKVVTQEKGIKKDEEFKYEPVEMDPISMDNTPGISNIQYNKLNVSIEPNIYLLMGS